MFNLGQLRKSQINSYMTELSYELANIEISSTSYSDFSFIDKVVDFSSFSALEEGKNYYMQFSISYFDNSSQQVKVYLTNNNAMENNQYIDTFKINPGEEEGPPKVFECIFTPDQNYNQIIFELQRGIIDYQTTNTETNTVGREITLTINKMMVLTNVLDLIEPNSLVKIGIQGTVGLLMCINGEPIRIGRTGIYELMNNNINIISIGFAVDENDYFIMDYQY